MKPTFDYFAARMLYDAGKSMDEVASCFGVSVGSIHRAVHKSGGTARKRITSESEYKWQIVQGYKCRKIKGRIVKEHTQIAEKVIGKELPKNAVVHHVNGKRDDNRNENLVICNNHKYHMLLHVRTEALKVSGNANYRKCQFCKQHDDINFMLNGGGNKTDTYYHALCRSQYRKGK